jgi:anti-anti-sigma factor
MVQHEVRIEVKDSDDGDRLARVRGVLDVFSSPALAKRALANLPTKTHDLVIDLRDVSFVDSAGVSALVRLQQEARSRAVEVRARLGNAQHSINATAIDVLRRVIPIDD